MPHATISKSSLKGSITPPPSLELAYRFVWAAILGEGGAIGNCPNHPDIKKLFELGTQLGADIKFEKNTADIFGSQDPKRIHAFNCQNSSRVSKLALPLAITFDDITSLRQIKIPTPAKSWLEEAGAQLDIRITNMRTEVSVFGPPKNQWLQLQDRAGAYWLTGFMMAFPLTVPEKMLELDEYVSTHSSFQYTLETYDAFEIDYSYNLQSKVLTIPQNQYYPARYIDVPPSWKEGSYYIAAFLLCGDGELLLSENTKQPQKDFWLMFHINKALATSQDGDTLFVSQRLPLSMSKKIDIRPYPALAPLIMLLATQAQQPVELSPMYPISPLTQKRLNLTAQELNKIGAQIVVSSTSIQITPSILKGGKVDSQNDARVAMTLALAGLICQKPLHIENIEAINKANKNFLSDLKRLGAKINF